MDITFQSESEVPLPPGEVRFRSVRIDPYPDGRRVKVLLELTPFQVRPNLEISLLDPAGDVAATVHIVEASEPRMALTLHLRHGPHRGIYTARLTLSYPELEPVEVAGASFELWPPTLDPGD